MSDRGRPDDRAATRCLPKGKDHCVWQSIHRVHSAPTLKYAMGLFCSYDPGESNTHRQKSTFVLVLGSTLALIAYNSGRLPRPYMLAWNEQSNFDVRLLVRLGSKPAHCNLVIIRAVQGSYPVPGGRSYIIRSFRPTDTGSMSTNEPPPSLFYGFYLRSLRGRPPDYWAGSWSPSIPAQAQSERMIPVSTLLAFVAK